jgi:hypothetical protein
MSRQARRAGPRRGLGTFAACLRHFLTPRLFRQARQAQGAPRHCRWDLRPLLLVLCAMTWCTGDSTPERFETARAFFVCLQPKRRRPGKTASGFQKALKRLPTFVLRLVASAVRARLLLWGAALRNHDGWAVFGCDGSELACPRTCELERRLGTKAPGKPGKKLPPAPQVGLSALVHLHSGVLWAWRLGKGAIDERGHLEALIGTLPACSLVVGDCGYQGYELAWALHAAGHAFLFRVSSLTTFYSDETLRGEPLRDWQDGQAWYWPGEAQRRKLLPLRVRLLRVRDRARKHDVWLATNVPQVEKLSAEAAGHCYKMRWGSEGFFRAYKRTLGKVKLVSRTVRLVHREAEGSLLAVQLLLAQAGQARLLYGHAREAGSARELVLAVRREMRECCRGKRRGRRGYQERLSQARLKRRARSSPKACRVWPSRADHKPPKPPKLRELDDRRKALLQRLLHQN